MPGTFYYSHELADKPTELYRYEDPAAKDAHGPGDDPREMQVQSGWARAKEFSLDREGFELHSFLSDFGAGSARVGDWEDDQRVRNDFYPEVVEFVKRTTGAKRVLVFDHTIRTRKNAHKKETDEENTTQRAPISHVHCD